MNDDLELYDDQLNEGVIRWVGGAVANTGADVVDEVSSWFKGARAKVEKTERMCNDLIKWLEDEKKSNPGLNLEMGIGTFFKSSAFFRWRYYFILHDRTYTDSLKSVKAGGRSATSKLADISLGSRFEAASLIDRSRKIDDLIAIVRKYRDRANELGNLMLKKQDHRGFSFQVMMLGVTDLRYSIQQTVRLAK